MTAVTCLPATTERELGRFSIRPVPPLPEEVEPQGPGSPDGASGDSVGIRLRAVPGGARDCPTPSVD